MPLHIQVIFELKSPIKISQINLGDSQGLGPYHGLILFLDAESNNNVVVFVKYCIFTRPDFFSFFQTKS